MNTDNIEQIISMIMEMDPDEHNVIPAAMVRKMQRIAENVESDISDAHVSSIIRNMGHCCNA
jgi:chorismate mutase